MALLQKAGMPQPGRSVSHKAKPAKECGQFLDEMFGQLPGIPVQNGDRWYLVPELASPAGRLRTVRCGVELGSVVKGRFVPAHGPVSYTHLMNFLRKYGWLAAIFAVLLGAVFFVGPGREMAAGTDITSEEIMIGDMIYDRQNPQDPARILLQRYVSPLTEHSLGRKYVTDVYAQDGTLPSEEFETYDSQPGLAGIVYGLADRLLPFSPQTRLAVLHLSLIHI